MMSLAYPLTWDQEGLVQICCDSCGSDIAFQVAVRPDGLKVVECPRCGLAYVNPRPRDEQIVRLYQEGFAQKQKADPAGRGGHEDYLALAQGCWSLGRSWELDMIERLTPLNGRRVVEIGSTDELLSLARLRGAFTVGLEFSPCAPQAAPHRRRGDIRALSLKALQNPEQPFDVALALGVIERVVSPRRLLESIARLLKPGGLLALSTPNYRCSLPLGNRWRGFQACPEHLYFFSPLALLRLASDCRLSLILWATRNGSTVNGNGMFTAAIRSLVKKIPGATRLRRALEDLPWPPSWELFGQGYHLFALFRVNGHA